MSEKPDTLDAPSDVFDPPADAVTEATFTPEEEAALTARVEKLLDSMPRFADSEGQQYYKRETVYKLIDTYMREAAMLMQGVDKAMENVAHRAVQMTLLNVNRGAFDPQIEQRLAQCRKDTLEGKL